MKIRQLVLKEFRCFQEFKMEFAPEHNIHVIIAENMVGKSAVMAALRLIANTYTSGLKQERQIQLSDHRIIGSNPIADVSPDVSILATAFLRSAKGDEQVVWRKYKTQPKGEKTKIEIIEGKDPRVVSKEVNKLTAEAKATQPLFSFIGTEYIHVESSDTVAWDVSGKSIDGYDRCFDDKSIKKFLFKWLARMDSLMTESARKPLIADAYKDIPANAMAVFQYAVQSVLPDIKEIVWSVDLNEPIVRLSNNEIRPFSFLSDGFRYLILLAGELATRSFILNKHLGKEVLKEVHGLVLIDEFGIHLHPALQNDALLKMQSTFPNVQFIVTTHSPLLLNGLRKEQVHIISVDKEGNRVCNHPEEDIVGLGANDILTNVFGLPTTMDKEFLGLNEEYTILFEKRKNGRLNDAQERRFSELSKMLSRLRIDPNLQLVQEDPITALVKQSIAADGKMIANGKNGMAKEVLKQKVDDILKAIFSEPVT